MFPWLCCSASLIRTCPYKFDMNLPLTQHKSDSSVLLTFSCFTFWIGRQFKRRSEAEDQYRKGNLLGRRHLPSGLIFFFCNILFNVVSIALSKPIVAHFSSVHIAPCHRPRQYSSTLEFRHHDQLRGWNVYVEIKCPVGFNSKNFQNSSSSV